MSRRDEAIETLVEMLDADKHCDRINAADKLLRSDNIDSKYIGKAIRTLEIIMNDLGAEPRDRVNAADKLKNFSAPRSQTKQDQARVLAAMSDAELEAIIEAAPLFSGHDSLLD